MCQRLSKDILSAAPPRSLLDDPKIVSDEGLQKTLRDSSGTMPLPHPPPEGPRVLGSCGPWVREPGGPETARDRGAS
eukprot:9502654-Pyramimonas_sp.AAC.1